jgi:hypothetical protein
MTRLDLTRSILFVALVLAVIPRSHAAQTDFAYKGYVKMDVLSTYYRNGDVSSESPLRDFHLPSQIPVGETNENYDLDFHAKESRFNFETTTRFDDGRSIRGFLELDFLLSKQGDEKVSNSYNPRLRHFYLETGRWLLGQTWTTFMIVILPDDLDFAGAAEGVVFGRQPQIRYTRGPWQASLENPETIVSIYDGNSTASVVTESGRLPDVVLRRNLKGDWGLLSVAAVGRQLHYKDSESGQDDGEFGFGLTAGGELSVGQRDDFRFQLTGGQGLGRYTALNFVNSAAVDSTGKLSTIDGLLGFIGYRHFWTEKLWSSVNVSLFFGSNEAAITGPSVNKEAQSYSINLLYSPFPTFTIGAELMHARRVLESGIDGTMDRLQLSARYSFGYSSAK